MAPSDGPAAPAALVMAPTRELAAQIHLEARRLTFGAGATRAVVVYGGAMARKHPTDTLNPTN